MGDGATRSPETSSPLTTSKRPRPLRKTNSKSLLEIPLARGEKPQPPDQEISDESNPSCSSSWPSTTSQFQEAD